MKGTKYHKYKPHGKLLQLSRRSPDGKSLKISSIITMKTHAHSLTENHTLSTMLLAASHSLFFSPLSLSSPLLRRLKPHRAPFPPLTSAIRMSATTTQIVEHFVLFKVKPETEPSKVSAMVDGLNGLISIDGVLHLTAGEILRNRSSSLTFTHLIHSRYKSKEDLAAYSANPRHIGLVRGTIFPIIDDIMAIDFVSGNVAGTVIPTPGSAMRITFLKLKEGLREKEKREVLGVIGGIKDQFESIDQLSFGENFTVERSKGFSIGSLAICKGLSELDCLDSNSELVNLHKEKVKDLLEKVVVLDYVIPHSV